MNELLDQNIDKQLLTKLVKQNKLLKQLLTFQLFVVDTGLFLTILLK